MTKIAYILIVGLVGGMVFQFLAIQELKKQVDYQRAEWEFVLDSMEVNAPGSKQLFLIEVNKKINQ